MLVAPSPGYVVGWSIGVFLFAVLAASLSFDARIVWTTAFTSAVAQTLLVRGTGMTWDLVATSGVLLILAALITTTAAARLEQTVTELFRKEADRAAAEQNALALLREQEAVRSWTELVVHDLKQPLASAIALADLAAHDLSQGRGDAAGDLHTLSGELLRMEQMMKDLVAVARMEQGSLVARPVEVEVHGLLLRIARVHGREAEARGVRFEVEGDPSLRARLDPMLIVRALENLVGNALRFVRKGDRIRLCGIPEDGRVVLSVANSGPPNPAALRDGLFAKSATSERGAHHAGLGLYFCRLAAEAHGGVALLADTAGWSVDFRLSLPR